MMEIWLTSFKIDLAVDSTTFLERVADYAHRQGYTDLDLEESSLIAKKGWISGTPYGGSWAATAPFDLLSIQVRGRTANVILSSVKCLVLFYLVVPLWAAVGLWWMSFVSRVFAGLLLASILYLLIQIQGSLRVRANLRRLAT